MTRPNDIAPALWERAEILMDQFRDVADDREFVARILAADRAPRVEALGLTAKQQQVLDFIVSYMDQHGVSPSYDEIAQHLGFGGKGQAHAVVHRLADRGAIALRPNHKRSISVLVPGGAA